jgi:hypothetical protein
MASKKPFIDFIIEPELLKRVDDFMFENRFRTRAAAFKWLIKKALEKGLKPDNNERDTN